MARPVPRTRDELEDPLGGTPEDDEGPRIPFWISVPFLLVGATMLVRADPRGIWEVLRWGGFLAVGTAGLLWRIPRLRRHPNALATLALLGALAWVASKVAWLVGVLR